MRKLAHFVGISNRAVNRILSENSEIRKLCASEVMASVFGDRIIFIDYFDKGKTIERQYYANLLQRLSEKIK